MSLANCQNFAENREPENGKLIVSSIAQISQKGI